jgi:hypothetical protein
MAFVARSCATCVIKAVGKQEDAQGHNTYVNARHLVVVQEFWDHQIIRYQGSCLSSQAERIAARRLTGCTTFRDGAAAVG